MAHLVRWSTQKKHCDVQVRKLLVVLETTNQLQQIITPLIPSCYHHLKTMVDHHKWSGNGSCPYVKEPLWVPMIFPWMAWGQDRSPCEDHERPVAWRFFFRRWQFLLWMEEILHQLIDGLATFNCRGSTIQGGAGVLNHPQWWFVEYTNGIVIRIQQLTLTQNIKYIHSIVTLGYLTYIELIV